MSQTADLTFPLPDAPTLHHPTPALAALREERPVAELRTPDGKTLWLVTRHADARTVFTDPRFSSAAAAEPGRPNVGLNVLASQTILGMDPPEHTRLRKLVTRAFTRRRVETLRPKVEQIVADLLDTVERQPRPVDVVRHLSLPMPVQVICDLLGVPVHDRELFQRWTGTLLSDLTLDQAKVMGAFTDMAQYLSGLIEEKRKDPGDDLLTALIAARDDEDRLSETEMVGLSVIILVGGFETTANQLSLSLLALLQYPEELARLRADMDLIVTAVDELMRFVQLAGNGGGLIRVTTEPVTLSGVTIPAGEAVVPVPQSANRDATVFENPDQLDITRTTNPHLAFGSGVHHCLGAQLARLELQVALQALLTRFPNVRVAIPDSEVPFRQGSLVRTVEELPITW